MGLMIAHNIELLIGFVLSPCDNAKDLLEDNK